MTVTPLQAGGAVAVLHEISDVERMEKMRRDFIANVSHELRTPLTNIQGYSEALLDSLADDRQKGFMLTVQKNVDRMTRLTDDLLALARVESGEDVMHLHAIAPEEVLED